MTHFDYNPKEITEKELEDNIKELLSNSSFKHGDTVKLKGDVNSPIMAVSNITIKKQDFIYQKYMRCYVEVTCMWFNKSKQDFTTANISVLSLEKINQ